MHMHAFCRTAVLIAASFSIALITARSTITNALCCITANRPMHAYLPQAAFMPWRDAERVSIT